MTSTAERIAELRGWEKQVEIPDGRAIWDAPFDDPMLTWGCVSERWQDAPTASVYDWDPEYDWAQAEVLLEELATELKDVHLEYLEFSGWKLGTCNQEEWFPAADTPQAAICQAWIAMKESNID